ncbi:MAG: DNA-binding protein WhiA [Clostridiales bacterium]|nr:DNA-binding protein WhiA [Clostridiales bacterium]
MSFASDCKKELCLIEPEKACCYISEISGLYMSTASLSLLGRGKVNVTFTNESMAVCRRIYTLLTRHMHLSPQIHYVTTARFGGKRKCVLTLGTQQSPQFLKSLHMMVEEDDGDTLVSTSPKININRFCCMKAFLRGVMLGGGTMSSPEQGYHLELPVKDGELRAMLARCFQRLDLPIKMSTRKENAYLYLKQSDQIVTFLTAVGAHQAVMQIEDLRVRRQVIESVNRAINCDNANLEKQMNASDEQISAILSLQQSNVFSSLPLSLQEVANARLNAPAANLTELGQLLNPPIGKSGVNHRMRRLMTYAATPKTDE